MKLFDAALQAIQTHRVFRQLNPDSGEGEFACAGCSWTAPFTEDADVHLADEIDRLVG